MTFSMCFGDSNLRASFLTAFMGAALSLPVGPGVSVFVPSNAGLNSVQRYSGNCLQSLLRCLQELRTLKPRLRNLSLWEVHGTLLFALPSPSSFLFRLAFREKKGRLARALKLLSGAPVMRFAESLRRTCPLCWLAHGAGGSTVVMSVAFFLPAGWRGSPLHGCQPQPRGARSLHLHHRT